MADGEGGQYAGATKVERREEKEEGSENRLAAVTAERTVDMILRAGIGRRGRGW